MDFNILAEFRFLSLTVFLYMIELDIEQGNNIILRIFQLNGPFGLKVREGEYNRVNLV